MKSSSWIRLCIYHDAPSDIKDVLDTHSTVQGYALALHDKFTEEELKSEKGDPHVHVVLHLNHNVSFNSVQKWFAHLDGNCLSTSCENPLGAYQYLTHRNNPEKYQFSPEIVTETAGFLAECKATNNAGSARRPDHTAEIFGKYLEGAKLTELVKEHGKDFLYHYTQYREVLKDVRSSIAKEEERDTKLRVLNAFALNVIHSDPDLCLDALQRYYDNHDVLTDNEIVVLAELERIASTVYYHKYREGEQSNEK